MSLIDGVPQNQASLLRRELVELRTRVMELETAERAPVEREVQVVSTTVHDYKDDAELERRISLLEAELNETRLRVDARLRALERLGFWGRLWLSVLRFVYRFRSPV